MSQINDLKSAQDFLEHVNKGGSFNARIAVAALVGTIERLTNHSQTLEKELTYVQRNSFPRNLSRDRGYAHKEPYGHHTKKSVHSDLRVSPGNQALRRVPAHGS